jgi:hypothetical protein
MVTIGRTPKLAWGFQPTKRESLCPNLKKKCMKKTISVICCAVAVLFSGATLADEHGHAHHNFTNDIDAFHAVLAPVWHARPSLERTANACAKTSEMTNLASEIKSRDASQLIASLAALKTKCEEGKSDVDGALYDVHEAFHRLIEAQAGKQTK